MGWGFESNWINKQINQTGIFIKSFLKSLSGCELEWLPLTVHCVLCGGNIRVLSISILLQILKLFFIMWMRMWGIWEHSSTMQPRNHIKAFFKKNLFHVTCLTSGSGSPGLIATLFFTCYSRKSLIKPTLLCTCNKKTSIIYLSEIWAHWPSYL